jgi:Ni/Co efflux regulator RcnB
MKTKHLIIPAMLAALCASAPGFAQDRDHSGDRDRNQSWNQNDRSQNDRSQNERDQNDRNQNWNQNDRNRSWNQSDRGGERRDGYQARGGGRYGNEGYGGEHRWDGAGPEHSWHRGDRLPSQYRSHQYVVDDWRGHHLRRPPRGYHWVQSGGDYVLTAIATGVIADLIINSR